MQGVGFRPFVYRLATELSLAGRVRNDSHGAWIEVEGEPDALERFQHRLQTEAPPLARIYDLRTADAEPRGESSFVIVETQRDAGQDVGVTPDAAVCADCLREMFDPADRRFRYPFINCTNCGPRYSIIETVPYDRPNTSMRVFPMCPACRREYDDPADRRFHAQPNACPACGPRLWFVDRAGRPLDVDPIREAARIIREGGIVAIKGIGGFHLACRADLDQPVTLLRKRKGRETKPFAVMVPDIATARQLAFIDAPAEPALCSAERPIVLLRKSNEATTPQRDEGRGGRPPSADRNPQSLSPAVAFDTPTVGILLPYAPLHHLLFAEGLGPIVMTSGNPSNEPLTCENEEALERLGPLADGFVLHDRDIRRRVDDSVVISGPTGVTPIRRARGFAPAAVVLPKRSPRTILAVGGELKCTVCLYRGHDAVLSEHLGDLKSASTYRHFVGTIDKLAELLRCRPDGIAHDLHPTYLSTQYARRQTLPLFGVQHHHAHIVSCIAEHGEYGPVLGVSCDGTGYGEDGAIWGGEILVARAADYRRVGHLRYFLLPGGDAAAEQTYRPALSVLRQIDATRREALLARMPEAAGGNRPMIEQVMDRRVNCPETSSLGRLFDAAAWILSVCRWNGHEAQAAMALEERADEWLRRNGGRVEPYPFALNRQGSMLELDWRPLLAALAADAAAERDSGESAARFHEGIARMIAVGAAESAEREGLKTIALSGGCFANQILLQRTVEHLEAAGFRVLTHRRVPCGDGGLALGQAVAAAARMETNDVPGGTGTGC